MGAFLSCFGRRSLIDAIDGGYDDYKANFIEDHVLGEGEFGVVRLVHQAVSNEQYACKELKKGPVFKDNVLYTPLSAETLRNEVEILQSLAGEHFCLKLQAVYEARRSIFVVTECCWGGEMLDYLSLLEEDLQTQDVSRIAFQLLDAVSHCARNEILHRDIKPENIMFKSAEPKASLRLIDFGSGTISHQDDRHTTFAGTAFYSAPEMFERRYTTKTDVWSAGVTLYVLVAGYPSEALQQAFNVLLSSSRDSVKQLPNLPDDMPEQYYYMLEQLLVVSPAKRKSAAEVLSHPFVTGERSQNIETTTSGPKDNEQSKILQGSVRRHSLFQDFKKFERSLTTILVTMLEKSELYSLVKYLNNISETDVEVDTKLKAVTISKLKDMLLDITSNKAIIDMIDDIPDAPLYENHSYEFSLLEEFLPKQKKRKAQQGLTRNKSKGKRNANRADDSGQSDTEEASLSLHSAPDITGRLSFVPNLSRHGRQKNNAKNIAQSVHNPSDLAVSLR